MFVLFIVISSTIFYQKKGQVASSLCPSSKPPKPETSGTTQTSDFSSSQHIQKFSNMTETFQCYLLCSMTQPSSALDKPSLLRQQQQQYFCQSSCHQCCTLYSILHTAVQLNFLKCKLIFSLSSLKSFRKARYISHILYNPIYTEIHTKKIYRERKEINGCQGLGGRREQEVSDHGHRISFQSNKKCSKIR